MVEQHPDGNKPARKYEIEFITPCTHKSGGNYVLFPSANLIIQSLYTRFASFSEEFSLDDPEAKEQIASNCHITGYNLRTSWFSLNNSGITGYTGRLWLTIGGPEQLARLAGLLLTYAEFSGIGIKTSLGMGGCRVREVERSREVR